MKSAQEHIDVAELYLNKIDGARVEVQVAGAAMADAHINLARLKLQYGLESVDLVDPFDGRKISTPARKRLQDHWEQRR